MKQSVSVRLSDGVEYAAHTAAEHGALTLELNGADGQRWSCALPFVGSAASVRLFPLPFADDDDAFALLIDASAACGGDGPSLYTLTHPLDEVRPVDVGATAAAQSAAVVGVGCGWVAVQQQQQRRKGLAVHALRRTAPRGGALAADPTRVGTLFSEFSLADPPLFRDAGSEQATCAFSAFGRECVCVVRSELRLLDVVSLVGRGRVIARLKGVAAAAPFEAQLGGERRMLLAVASDAGRVSVLFGDAQSQPCEIASADIGVAAAPLLVRDCGDGCCVDAVFESSTVRCTLHCLPLEELASASLAALISALPRRESLQLLQEFNNPSLAREFVCDGPQNTAGDWSRFAKAVLRVVIGQQQEKPKDAWSSLLSSEFHLSAKSDPSLRAIVSTAVVDASTFETALARLACERKIASLLVQTLFLVYEDAKLSTFRAAARRRLAKLLHKLCASELGWKAHAEHLLRDFPEMASTWPSTREEDNDEPAVPSIYGWLLAKLSGASPAPLPTLPRSTGATERIRVVCELFELALGHAGNHQAVVAKMAEERLSSADLETFPTGVSLLLREACIMCRASPPLASQEVLELVGRADILAQMRMEKTEDEELLLAIFQSKLTPSPAPPRPPPDVGGESKRFLQLQQRALAAAGIAVAPAAPSAATTTSAANAAAEGKPQIRDGAECDDRITAMLFPADRRVEETRHLLQWSERAVIPIEETTGSEWVAEQQELLTRLALRTLALPAGRGAFVLSLDRLSGGDRIVGSFPQLVLDGKNLSGHDVALDIKPSPEVLSWPQFHNGVATALRFGADMSRTTQAWLSHNPGPSERDAYAGFLLGLGLQGLLPSNPTGRLVELLSTRGAMEGVALLLGLAAENAGTMNEAVFKTLSMHVPFLRPAPASASVNGGVSQSAAVAADGVEVPMPTVSAALLGVGLVFRGTGHRRIVEVLLEELETQPSFRALNDRESYALSAGLGLGLVSLGCGDSIPGVSDLRLVDTLLRLAKGGPESESRKASRELESAAAAQAQRPSLFFTNGWIDTNVTAPGAILALALMFFGTGNRAVLRELRVPQTRAELEAVRPDHLLLRVLASSLISWSDIEPTEEWVASQIPRFIEDACLQPTAPAWILAAADAISVGACLALGIRFAGTRVPSARSALLFRLQELSRRESLAFSVSERILHAQREIFIDNLAIATSLVMAGSGDLDVMRTLRALRVRAGASAAEGVYGHHFARHMALGFLFLGGGMLTFANTKEAAAMLVCSLFPLWPAYPSDCSYHLQAFRHLYVLAVECRLAVACDVDSRRPCLVPLTVHSASGSVASLMAPVTLPRLDDVLAISVDSPRYWPMNLSRHSATPSAWLLRAGTSPRSCPLVVFVKRKSGFLPYSEDPTGVRSIDAEATALDISSALHAFSSDPVTLAFVGSLCRPVGQSEEDTFAFMFAKALLECVSGEKGELLSIYVALINTVFGADVLASTTESLSNVALVVAAAATQHSKLLDRNFIADIEERIRCAVWDDKEIALQLKTFATTGTVPADPRRLFAAAAALGLPLSRELVRAHASIASEGLMAALVSLKGTASSTALAAFVMLCSS